ncbi:HEPN domain-containing protein [Pseudomonas sp. HY7a-MNA-CIBAN-0227]|uniref:ApeA N-terminal domain 1-containing protein n=1 Tax=Pseudomonas sp. HY7a-MNA-CIBAN-0227 TaxID=3140474 RepID=UPI00332C6CBF
MRIEEEIKRQGEFWLPESPEEKFPGVLTISDGGEIELEITTNKTPLIDEDKIEVGRIVGVLEKEGAVTLEKAFFRQRSISFGAPITSTLRINKAFLGVMRNNDDEILFSDFSFHLDQLDDWLSITGIKTKYSEDYRSATISYEPLEKITATLESGECIHVDFRYTLPSRQSITEAKITHSAYFTIHSEKPEPIEHFIGIAYKIANLLCFATARTISISEVEAKIAEVSCDDGTPFSVRAFYPSRPYSKTISKASKYEILFNYKSVEHRWEDLLRYWFRLYDTLAPTLSLYFSTQNGTHKYLDSKFLSLAQAAETLSRRTNSEVLMDAELFKNLQKTLMTACPPEHSKWLEARLMHGNEINLSKRLKALVKPFKSKLGNSRATDSTIRKIVDTRNYLTHYDESKKGIMSDHLKLWQLCQKLEVIIELNILALLQFSETDIDLICKPPHSLSQKLS